MKPVLKWAGGKRQLSKYLTKYINLEKIGKATYFEPFFGGGYLFFMMAPNKSVINDLNEELINVYLSIKNDPSKLIELLSDHEKRNSKEYFYKIRNFDRMPNLALSNVQRAARTIYLNKTCYNGLYRVNSSGQFNVPFGNYKNPKILDKENILDIHNFMVKSNVKITNLDFDSAVKKAKKGDIIYFDPPYDYEDQEGFVNYIKEGFTREDLVRLKNTCDNLIKKGCLVLISNNDTKFVRSLFKGDNFEIVYETQNIYANRTINSNVKMRKNAKEVLIYGKYKSGI